MHVRVLVVALLVGTSHAFPSSLLRAKRDAAKDIGMNYLMSFGYILPAGYSEGPGNNDGKNESYEALLREYQQFAHLPETGKFDDPTLRKMAEPRCGLPDVKKNSEHKFKWSTTNLTYSIHNSENSSMAVDQIREVVADAFNIWAAVTPLTFTEVKDHLGNIKIRFVSGDHLDADPFDGKGGKYAHAFYPPHGDIHFDRNESWLCVSKHEHLAKIKTKEYLDFVATAIHEIGHALGLDHSADETSIMHPFWKAHIDAWGEYDMPKPNLADWSAIQSLYGEGGSLQLSVKDEKKKVLIKSQAHGTYLRAHREGSRVDMAPQTQDLERWYIGDLGRGQVLLKSSYLVPHHFLRAHAYGGVDLNQKAAQWEIWRPRDNGDGTWSFKSVHGTWLSGREDGSVAARGIRSTWEQFVLEKW